MRYLPILSIMLLSGTSVTTPEPLTVGQRLSVVLESSDFPALSRQIIDMLTALDDDVHALQRLANVVLREYSLTLAVVRTANSVHYRRAARPIQSATHAMMMLGARTVRELASSLMLFENYSRKSPELKELMLLSLLTANHARATAVRLQLQDPEEAHLCGMFRNLGEVLIACYFPEEYRRIRAMMKDEQCSEQAATKAVLGFPFADLAVEVSRHWGLPDSVVQGIRARPAASASLSAAVTSFSHDLTHALYRADSTAQDAAASIELVIEQHGTKVKLNRDQIGGIVTDALEETRELFVNPQIATDRMRFRQLTGAARAALGDSVTAREENFEEAESASVIALRSKLRQELDEKVDISSGAQIGEILLLALEAVMRAGPFDRVLACFLTTDRLRLAARAGLGKGAEELMTKFDFPVSIRGGPVVMLTQQRQPVYLPADRSMSTIEARWAHSVGLTQFGVFPLVVLGKVIGCLYCERNDDAEIPDRATIRFVKSITEILTDAIARRRSN